MILSFFIIKSLSVQVTILVHRLIRMLMQKEIRWQVAEADDDGPFLLVGEQAHS